MFMTPSALTPELEPLEHDRQQNGLEQAAKRGNGGI
jgi:hypothetical protein